MKVLGIMSGTSMDGVDLALCDIQQNEGSWKADIIKAVTIPYNETWRVRLSQLRYQYGEVLTKTDVFYGRYLGDLARVFRESSGLEIDLVASHGHTIFHNPQKGWTTQIGDGATLSHFAQRPVVSNFRRADVAAGGQGAPLVAIGDQLLFNDYHFCLNLGGFSNISACVNGRRVAFDVSPCNIVLNRLARERGLSFDEGGALAELGQVIYPLLEQLNEIDFYHQAYPKSLGREWINKQFWHVVREFDDQPVEDRMKTLVMHAAVQVARAVEQLQQDGVCEPGRGRMLVTGGGAYNQVLMDFLRSECPCDIEIPDSNLIEYKEALIFALLGAMRVSNVSNVLASATGASADVIGGSLDGDFSALLR
ncbi:MAG: anhydro-N-acetylmuramic acid kinase [Bacteroidia bacterium]